MAWVDPELAKDYRASGWWSDETLSDVVRQHAHSRPAHTAYVCGTHRMTWAEFDIEVDRVAQALIAVGVDPGDRVAVCMSDSIDIHVVYVAVERVGATTVGVGSRAGRREVVHLLDKVAATVIITGPIHGRCPASDFVDELRSEGLDLDHLQIDLADSEHPISHRGEPLTIPDGLERTFASRRLEPDDLFLINSTSGTTGLPKAVMHTQNRWYYFHTQVLANGELGPDDIIVAAVPAPFGFGIWTSHVTPIRLGACTVVMERFTAAEAMATVERERATVLCCVSTQFIMMLADESLGSYDLTSLRVVFTGGEAVPYERALAFERETAATILQFYGSNETGLLSGTNVNDSLDRRLRTAGRVVPEMNVRLFDGPLDVTDTGRGQPACKGPATGIGYLDDDAANEQLLTEDGWMLMGDICEIDADGYLTVTGRLSDFIVRGGKNISLAVIETDLLSHPAVSHAAAVPMPDPVLGERVCAYVELRAGAELDLEGLTKFLVAGGVSKELFPERLVVLDELPRSSGAKIAKGELKADAARYVAAAASRPLTTTSAGG